MIGYTQTQHRLKITTPLGDDKLLLRSLQGEESISGLFQFTVELVSEDAAIDFSQIVGKSVTITIDRPGTTEQYINGVVGRFAQAGRDSRLVTYYADIHPWLWLLTKVSNSQIFQNKSVPDIVKAMFDDLGFTDYEDSLTGTYQPREYCVQYQETAFNFVSRLLESEGIFYYFEHDTSSHKLVLADDATAYGALAGMSSVRLWQSMPGAPSDDVVTGCTLEQHVVSGKYQTVDFNFETPSTSLLSTATGDNTKLALFEYPAGYQTKDRGDAIATLRLSQEDAPEKQLTGTSTCGAFHAGLKFTLSGHHRDDVNGDYALAWVSHNASQEDYSNSFTAIPATVTYRPERTTPTPRISGSQTAMVTGKSGEEIWTDQYGRIKVKFHWDRATATDETTSCWIRVAQNWAGKQYGTFFLPRIGQEVVVSFLEGDPDRPLVTASVYNAEQTVPYTLPTDQTKSTIKSNSSKGGGGFNEIRFEDKKDSEEIFIQAQKDMNVTVLNNETLAVKAARTITVDKDETHTVKAKRTLEVTDDETHTNKAKFTQTVTGNFSLTVDGNLTIDVKGSISIKSGTSLAVEAGTSLSSKAGTSLKNEAGTSLDNKAGTTLTNDAGISLTNKASASQTVDGGGMLELKGGMVKIN